VAKLVDAPASGAGDRKVVGVRVPSWAPNTPTSTYMGAITPITSPSPTQVGITKSKLTSPEYLETTLEILKIWEVAIPICEITHS
jgi:hypothetical protein